MTAYSSQHDQHLIPWLSTKFNLTVQDHEFYYNSSNWWLVFVGDYDLDCKSVTGGPSVFNAAVEYAACYDGALFDKLCAIELGEQPAIEQFKALVLA